MSRPQRTSFDPAWLESAGWGEKFSVDIHELMGATDGPDVLALVIDRLVERLQEPDRTCVHMSIMAGCTFQETADLLSEERWLADPDAPPVHRKTAWKWAQRGLDQVKAWLVGTPWLLEMLAGQVPVDRPERESGPVPTGLESAIARTRAANQEDH